MVGARKVGEEGGGRCGGGSAARATRTVPQGHHEADLGARPDGDGRRDGRGDDLGGCDGPVPAAEAGDAASLRRGHEDAMSHKAPRREGRGERGLAPQRRARSPVGGVFDHRAPAKVRRRNEARRGRLGAADERDASGRGRVVDEGAPGDRVGLVAREDEDAPVEVRPAGGGENGRGSAQRSVVRPRQRLRRR